MDGVNSVEKRRRRVQLGAEAEQQTENPSALAPDPAPEQQPAEQHRRRRVQPPQQITQRIPKMIAPDDAPIPRLPIIEEPKPEKKRYNKKAGHTQKKVTPKDEASPMQRREKREKTIGACAAWGKAALQGIGGALLSAMLLLREGASGLYALLKEKTAQIREKQAQYRTGADDSRAADEEVILEAIRPEAYHGRGAQHAAQRHKDKQHAVSAPFTLSSLQKQRLISVALVIVALVSLYNIGSILLRTFRTTRLNAQLSEQHASMGGNQDDGGDAQALALYEAPEETPDPEATPAPEQKQQEAQTIKATAAPDLVRNTRFHHVGGDALPEMEALYNQNRDLVAWVNIPEVIDLPVVYRDNSYYLKRDFYKQKNTAGTIFLDENHPFKEKTQNLLLHGHNMKDGTMFGRLTQYVYDGTYIKNHPFINLSTLWRKEQYVIFAVLDVSLNPKEEEFFNYFTHATFSSDAEFTSYIRQLQLRSMFAIPIDVQPTDALLTLSTCLEENRLVIVARRLRQGETRQEMRDRIHTAIRQ